MTITATIIESLPRTILCNVTGNEDKKIYQSQVMYYRISESQTDEEAKTALQTMIENDEEPK